MPTLKKCPQCAMVAQLDALTCAGCGHTYRTQFPQTPPAPEPTQAFTVSASPPEPPLAKAARFRRQDRAVVIAIGAGCTLFLLLAAAPIVLPVFWIIIRGVQERMH